MDQCDGHVIGGGEVAAVAGFDGLGGQCHRQVGLAATGLAQKQHGPVLTDEAQRGQIGHELSIQARLELEIEIVHRPPVGEAGEAQPRREPTVGSRGGLFADDLGQELDMTPLLGLGLFGQGGEALRRTSELQVAEVVFELLIKPRRAHWPSPRSKWSAVSP